MKKIFLILTLLLSTTCFAQTTKIDFVGYWTANETLVECVIWLDKANNFQYVGWDKGSGQSLELLSIKYDTGKLTVRTRFKENNWVVTQELTLIDEYTMNAKYAGDSDMEIKYKKLK